MNDLSLFLDDVVAEAAIALKATHSSLLMTDEVVLEKRTRLYGCILHFQFMYLTQQTQNLPLLF